MSNYNDQEIKIRKGQSYNLAIQTAIADGRHHDTQYIVKQFHRHYETAALLQKLTPDQIVQILEDERVIKIIKELDDVFSSD